MTLKSVRPAALAAFGLALAALGGCQARPDAAARAGTAALPAAPVRSMDPDRLIGAARADVQALLGTPGLVRREPPAEIWQYQGDTCVFDLFLYDEAGAHRVTYFEARDVSAQRVDARLCLNDVLNAEAVPVS